MNSQILESPDTMRIINPYRYADGSTLLNGLIGWWKLDEGTGTTAADSSSSGNDGTLISTEAADWVDSGPSDLPSLSFDSDPERAEIGNVSIMDGLTEFSACGHINITDTGTFQILVSEYLTLGGHLVFFLGVYNDGLLVRISRNGTDTIRYATTGGLTDNTDHHIAVVADVDAGTALLYIDGVSKTVSTTESSSGSSLSAGTGKMMISGNDFSGGSTNGMTGEAADVRIYNRQLTSDEVGELAAMTGTPDAFKTGVLALSPVAYWRLGESAGTLMVDEMGNDDGTYVGAPTKGVAPGVSANNDTAVDFNGSSQYGDGGVASFETETAGSVSLLLKTDSLASTQYAFGLAENVASGDLVGTHRLDTSGVIGINVVGPGVADRVNGDTVLSTGTWYHVVATSNGSTYAIYVNGAAETLTVVSGTNSGNWWGDVAAIERIGVGVLMWATPTVHFNGVLDEVAVFDYALSASEVSDLFDLTGL